MGDGFGLIGLILAGASLTGISLALFVLASLVIDLLYPVVDPRIRLWGSAE